MNNKLPQIHLVYNRYKKASATKKAVVEIRILHNYKQKYISTGVWLYPHQWKDGKIINCEDIVELNKILDKIVSNVKDVLLDMVAENSVDISLLTERIRQKETMKGTFIDFCMQRAAIRKYRKDSDTQGRYDRFIRRFSDWGQIKTFDAMTDSNIIAYDKYLTAQKMKPYSKWQNYHRFLNSFIIDAIHEGLLTRNPYKWVNIDKGKNSFGIDRCLTPEEFRILKSSPMPTKSLEQVRDVFVFQVYTCLSYSDLKDFDYKQLTTVNNAKVYIGKRAKTQKTFTIPLVKPALDIIDKYNGKLPVISNVKYNAYLKAVAQHIGIDKSLSTHWARHTGATLLLNEGVPMQVVSKICGHSSTRITEQIYAKLLDETVVDAVSGIDM